MKTNRNTAASLPAIGELVPMRALQSELAHIFPSEGSLTWEVRTNRRAYVEAGALVEIAGRLMAHPATFKRVALALGMRKVATRAGIKER